MDNRDFNGRIPDGKLDQPEGKYDVCWRCDGDGIVEVGYTLEDIVTEKCPVCDGEGWITKDGDCGIEEEEK